MLAKLPILLSERESLYQLGVNVTRSSPGREGDFSSLFILECDGDKVPLCSPGQQMYLWPRAALSVALRLFALQTSLDKALTALDLEDTEKPELSLKTKMRRCDVRCLKGIRGMGLTSELTHEGEQIIGMTLQGCFERGGTTWGGWCTWHARGLQEEQAGRSVMGKQEGGVASLVRSFKTSWALVSVWSWSEDWWEAYACLIVTFCIFKL